MFLYKDIQEFHFSRQTSEMLQIYPVGTNSESLNNFPFFYAYISKCSHPLLLAAQMTLKWVFRKKVVIQNEVVLYQTLWLMLTSDVCISICKSAEYEKMYNLSTEQELDNI